MVGNDRNCLRETGFDLYFGSWQASLHVSPNLFERVPRAQFVETEKYRNDSEEKPQSRQADKLIDLSRRHNLLFFRPPKTGTLDFTPEDELGMADLIADETVAVGKLLGPGS